MKMKTLQIKNVKVSYNVKRKIKALNACIKSVLASVI